MMNQPYVMVALVSFKEDASRNYTSRLEEWINVTSRNFIKHSESNKPLKRGILKFKLNQNAMRVIVGTA
jgi:hypothetical protein